MNATTTPPAAEPADLPEAQPGVDRRGEWAALAAILALAAGLRAWRLDQNGHGNPYYGAAVRSMMQGWTNFFFGSFDPVGVVTVDKPPVALWIQVAGARLLGYGSYGLLLPQALMGVASVALTYHLVRRAFGAAAGLLAGLALAITPICVAVDRDNLPDTALVLTLLLATWALARAAETGRPGRLLLAMALVGLAFNIKMLAAFVVLPTLALAYALAAPIARRARLVHLAIGGVVVAATSLSWPIAVDLTPKGRRPYIGGSQRNSALELALGYNGLARIMGRGGLGLPGGPAGPGTALAPAPPDGPAPAATSAGKAAPDDEGPPPFPPGMGPQGGGPGGPGMRFPGGPGGPGMGPRGGPGFGGTPGLTRFGNAGMAGLITWLFPMAVFGGVAAAARAGRPRSIGREPLALLIWAGWFATHWVVFSFAQGIFHEYYTAVMGPATAALAGIGAAALWDETRRGGWRSTLLPEAILLTAAWQATIIGHYPDWKVYILPALWAGAGAGSAGLLASAWAGSGRAWSRAAGGCALIALAIGPAIWSLAPVLAPGVSMMPGADPTMLGARRDVPMGGPFAAIRGGRLPFEQDPAQTRALVAFLVANRHGESILVAGLASMSVAPIIIETGEPAIGIGGFMGGDKVLSVEEFAAMVEDGRLRFFLMSPGPGGGPGGMRPGGPGGPGGGPPGGGPPGLGNAEIVAWVKEHGKVVDSKLWQPEPAATGAVEPAGPPGLPFGPGGLMRMTKLYDLRPDLGLAGSVAKDK